MKYIARVAAVVGLGAASCSCRGAPSTSHDHASDAADAGAPVSWLAIDRSAELDPAWISTPAPGPLTFAEARDALWPRRPRGSVTSRSRVVRGAFEDGLPNPGDAEWKAVEIAATSAGTHASVGQPAHAFVALDAPVPVAFTWDGTLRRVLRVTGDADRMKDAASFRPDPEMTFGCLLPRIGCGVTPVVYLSWVGAEAPVARFLRAVEASEAQSYAMAGATRPAPRASATELRDRAVADWLNSEAHEAYDAFLRRDDPWALATGRMVLARRADTDAGEGWPWPSSMWPMPLRAVVADTWRRVRRPSKEPLGSSRNAALRSLEDISNVRWAHDERGCRFDFNADPIFRAVVAEGLTLAPVLIAVLEHDRRLTRALAEDQSSCPAALARTADVALAALDALLERRVGDAGAGGPPIALGAGAPERAAHRVRRALASAALEIP